MEILLAGTNEGNTDALTAMTLLDGEPIEITAPSVPTGDQTTDQLITIFGEENRSRPRDYEPLNSA